MNRMSIYIAAIVVLVVATAAARAAVLVSEGLKPGDMYHLIFVTEGTRSARSTDIADYNAFVQAEAERPGAFSENFGIDWFAIGSTETIDARDNALVTGAVQRLDGELVGLRVHGAELNAAAPEIPVYERQDALLRVWVVSYSVYRVTDEFHDRGLTSPPRPDDAVETVSEFELLRVE